MSWVLDASLALAWVLPDEGSKIADRLRPKLTPSAPCRVPALWWYEMSNALAVAQRNRRITATEVTLAATLFAALPIESDEQPSADTIRRLAPLSIQHGLSAYDAAYLELALRSGLGIATLDTKLAAAAGKAGARVWR